MFGGVGQLIRLSLGERAALTVEKGHQVTPSGTPARSRLMKMGIEEQEQNGVIAPKSAAMRLPQSPPRLIHCLSLCSGR